MSNDKALLTKLDEILNMSDADTIVEFNKQFENIKKLNVSYETFEKKKVSYEEFMNPVKSNSKNGLILYETYAVSRYST